MTKASILILLQSLLAGMQFINAGIAVVIKNPAVTLIIGGVVASLQVAVQQIGNESVPPFSSKGN